MGLGEWFLSFFSLNKSKREEVVLSASFNARELARAARRTLKDHKRALNDLRDVESDTEKKDLTKVLIDLKKFEQDSAHFEKDMSIVELGTVREERIGLDEIQSAENIMKILKKMGVPPSVIVNEEKFLDSLLTNWEADVRAQLRREQDMLANITALRRQIKAA